MGDDEEDEESESEEEEMDEEMLTPLATFEVCKHWRNTVTAPKYVPCSIMGEWGCLYLLYELKKNLATQDKTRITKSIDNFFHHSKRPKGVSIPFYQQQEHTLYIALKDALTLICPAIAEATLPLLPSEVRGVLFLKNCGLGARDRAHIAANLKDDWKLESVIRELRRAWSDEDLKAMDGKGNSGGPQIQRRGFHRNKAQYFVERDEEDMDHQDWSERLEEALEQAHQELDDLDELYFSQEVQTRDEWSEDHGYWQEEEWDWQGHGAYEEGWYEDDEPWQEEAEAYLQDVADFETNLDSCAAANLNSASAQRTWAEAKKLVAELKTSREYLPIVGIAARPMSDSPPSRAPPRSKGGKTKKGKPKRDKGKGKGKKKGKGKYSSGKTARPLGGTLRRDPGKGSPPKCLLCGGLHPTEKCPRKISGGSAGNNISRKRTYGNEVHEDPYVEPWWLGQPTNPDRWQYEFAAFETDKVEHAMVQAMAQHIGNFSLVCFETERIKDAVTGIFSNSEMAEAYSGFIAASMKGYAIVDTGATKSMSGIELLLHCQETLQRQAGEDIVLVDPEATTRFTYANGASDQSFGRVGIPHRCGLESDHHCIWFTAVPTKSPTLLGLDWLNAAGASLNTMTGVLHVQDGYQEPCTRLPTGHWALGLLE